MTHRYLETTVQWMIQISELTNYNIKMQEHSLPVSESEELAYTIQFFL